jgi:hypothetical protein
MQDWESADNDIRSPSPEPIYDPKTGLRMNTKELRYKEKYIKERNTLIAEVLTMDTTYQVRPIFADYFRRHLIISRQRSTGEFTFPTLITLQSTI